MKSRNIVINRFMSTKLPSARTHFGGLDRGGRGAKGVSLAPCGLVWLVYVPEKLPIAPPGTNFAYTYPVSIYTGEDQTKASQSDYSTINHKLKRTRFQVIYRIPNKINGFSKIVQLICLVLVYFSQVSRCSIFINVPLQRYSIYSQQFYPVNCSIFISFFEKISL